MSEFIDVEPFFPEPPGEDMPVAPVGRFLEAAEEDFLPARPFGKGADLTEDLVPVPVELPQVHRLIFGLVDEAVLIRSDQTLPAGYDGRKGTPGDDPFRGMGADGDDYEASGIQGTQFSEIRCLHILSIMILR